jgi:hypothetical protein
MAIRVFVCGDSFMSQDSNYPGEHFSEQLEFDVTNLARPGVGNIDICMQLQQALTQHADFVVLGITDPGRTEIPIGVYRGCRLENFRPGDAQCFVSDTIPTLIGEEPGLADKYSLPIEQRAAVKQYFTHIYSDELKNTVDSWALGYWMLRLQNNNVPVWQLPRDFCIYQHAAQFGNQEPRVFHTNAETQQQAARIINEKINSLRM